jgi:hypothetical protein
MSEPSNEINEIKAKSWNECISPRLESIVRWFKHEEWTLGTGAFLAHQKNQLQKLLNVGCDTQRKEDQLRGRIQMLEELLEMPSVIARQIELSENEKKRPTPSGTAGY